MSGKPVIFIIGGPGSGKGTQCALMIEKYGFCHLSTGDLLREEVNSGSERGQKLNAIMQSGQLVALADVLAMLKDAIDKNTEAKGFLIDGYPRELEQALEFEKTVTKCQGILYFDCSDETMVKRLVSRGLTSGRVDDNEETIKKRLATFHTYTQPILDHYGDLCKKIPAERETAAIFADVVTHVDAICAAK
ncbi:Adenylate kinase isoenzyme 1 [Halotydeus destructor]|nr:Adenylate kinase isoenzyme 1 [Halotydeus destructor]